ncbi:guanosine monophosphate reductase [Candidatus Pacearchaeota archaeon]|nr:guanosine monophosphate reductase [Candidatus Pacearchaeota archaeon]
MRTTLSYDDVLLIPQYSTIRSRAEVDVSVDLGRGLSLQLPILSSPMDTISETEMAIAMDAGGGAAIVHRYNTLQEQATIVSQAKEGNPALTVGAAIGVSGDFLNRAAVLRAIGIDFVCVDVAHGHHLSVKEAIGSLRNILGDMHIMAGNVATLAGINDLSDWGADSVRCNIGGGSICSTRVQTGHGMPGLETVFECAQTDRDVKIIADGGIRTSGDIVKALAAGADAVMCGSLLAGTAETPGKVMQDKDGHRWKIYRGMASKEAQIEWRGKYSSFEGVASRVPYRGLVASILEDLQRGIRSGFSYSGARTISELHAKAEFIQQSGASQTESGTHIHRRDW